MSRIHPTAIIDPSAEIAADAVIGAFAIIKGKVVIGPRVVVQEHCHLHGILHVGADCQIGPAAFLGLPPQHLKLDGEGGVLRIGRRCIVREGASIHRSTLPGEDHATTIGDDCLLMGAAHVGHDCQIGSNVIIANAALVGGHCIVQDRAFLGGGASLHQFMRVGRLAIIAGNEPVSQDLPPFSAFRYRGLKAYNAIGCLRSGMSRESIRCVRAAYRLIHTTRNIKTALARIAAEIEPVPEVQEMLHFCAGTKRGIAPSVRARPALGDYSSQADAAGDDE